MFESSLRLRALALALSVAAVAAAPTNADAQSAGSIRGRVIESGSQQGVPDARVTITGTTISAITNENGEFTISAAPVGPVEIVARRIGYGRQAQSLTVTMNEAVTANFTLSPAASQLDAVVVTGTGGEVERRTLGNSISTVDVAELTSKSSVLTVSEILQAKAPGVSILPGSGAPGTAGEIRIRGASSVAGYKPVVFIDGIRYNIEELGAFAATGGGTVGLAQSSQTTSALNNLNPADIESIEIVKGPAAATLYGAEAANGVIQIITKKGSRGQQALRWSFRGERGQNKWTRLPEQNYTTCDAAHQAATISTTDLRPLWPGCLVDANGQPVPVNTILTDNPIARDTRALREGDLSRVSLTTRGGGDRYSFYISGDRDTEQGVFYNSDNSRTSLRTNFGFNPTEKSDFALNLNWQDGRLRLPIQDESANGLLLSSRRGRPGQDRSALGAGNDGWSLVAPDRANRYRNFTNTERLTIGATANYSPFKWFQNRLIAGIDNTTVQAQLLFLPGEIDLGQDPDASTGANLRNNPMRRVLTIDYAGTLLWNPRTTLASTTKFGSQVISDESESLRATGIGIGAIDVTQVNLLQRSTGGETYSENNSVGYYLQEQIAWRDKLFVTAAARADDHSSFGTNFDLIVYPKFSVAYVVADNQSEGGFLGAARVNSLKLRGAWGRAGRAPTAYSAPQTYTVDRATLGTTTASALRTLGYGNPDLEPELGEEIELGFDLGVLDDRMGVDFTYYNKTTSKMLQSISIPPSTGFISSRLVNLGEVNNRGVEVAFFGSPVRGARFGWDTRLNIATNKNRLMAFDVEGKVTETPAGQAFGSVQQHRVGYPLGGFWVIPPQRDANGVAILTPVGAAIFNTGDTARRYYGSSVPTREIGFSNTITLFGFARVYALLDHKGGFNVYNFQERNRCQSNDNCWRANDPRARFPVTPDDSVLFKENAVRRNASPSPEWIQKGDFWKLREVSLTLDLPASMVRFSRAQAASIILSGRNLKLWSDYEGADPEVNSYGGRNFVRVDAYASPAPRRLSAAINLQF